MPFQKVSSDQGGRAVWIWWIDKVLTADIEETLTNELQVRNVRIDSRTILLGHAPAALIFQISPEEGPGPADVWFQRMHCTSLAGLKEDAVSIIAAGQDRLGVIKSSIGVQQCLWREGKAGCQTVDVFA